MTELIMNSNGHCFLCLNKVQHPLSELINPQTVHPLTPICSLTQLSRYLKLDMSKVFCENESISDQLLNKVQKSTLKAELCVDCADLNNRFSVAYRQFEKAEMEVTSCLKRIYQRLIGKCDNDNSNVIYNLLSLSDSASSEADELLPKLKIADVLRSETAKKCARKLRIVQPRVKIRRFTPSSKYTIDASKNVSRPKDDYLPSSDIKMDNNNIKLECDGPSHTIQHPAMDDDNSFSDDPNWDDFSDPGMESEASNPNLFTGKPVTSSQLSIVKPISGFKLKNKKHECPICKMKFIRRGNMRTHQKSAHLKFRYKCKLCAKEFGKSSNLNRHMQGIHERVRFRCDKCGKTFNEKSNLKTHQLEMHFGKRFPCKLCKRIFCRSGLRHHQRGGKCPALKH